MSINDFVNMNSIQQSASRLQEIVLYIMGYDNINAHSLILKILFFTTNFGKKNIAESTYFECQRM